MIYNPTSLFVNTALYIELYIWFCFFTSYILTNTWIRALSFFVIKTENELQKEIQIENGENCFKPILILSLLLAQNVFKSNRLTD